MLVSEELRKKIASGDIKNASMREHFETRITELNKLLTEAENNVPTDGSLNTYYALQSSLNAVANDCITYLFVMEMCGKTDEIPNDAIDAIKHVFSYDEKKLIELAGISESMLKTMKMFSDLMCGNKSHEVDNMK